MRQSCILTPNVRIRSELERTEYMGLCAGVGYSCVVIGIMRLVIKGRPLVAATNHGMSCGMQEASSRMAVAKSYHVVAPAAVIW